MGITIWKLLSLQPALNPADIADSSNQTSETTISHHLLCKFPQGTARVSFAFQALWKLYLKKKKIEVNKKKSIYFLGCRFGCWNWPIIEENKKCLLQSTSNFTLGKMDFFNDEKKRGKTQLNYFRLPITSVKLLLIQWLARIYPLAQHLFLDMSLDFKQSLLVHTNYSFKHWFEHNNNNNSNVQFSHNLSGKHSMQSFWKQ